MRTTFCRRASCFALVLAVRAESQTATRVSFSTVVRVSLQIDSASTAEFTARNFDLRVARDSTSATSEIQLVKRAGVHTGSLVRLSASGLHAPSGVIDVLGRVRRPAGPADFDRPPGRQDARQTTPGLEPEQPDGVEQHQQRPHLVEDRRGDRPEHSQAREQDGDAVQPEREDEQ